MRILGERKNHELEAAKRQKGAASPFPLFWAMKRWEITLTWPLREILCTVRPCSKRLQGARVVRTNQEQTHEISSMFGLQEMEEGKLDSVGNDDKTRTALVQGDNQCISVYFVVENTSPFGDTWEWLAEIETDESMAGIITSVNAVSGNMVNKVLLPPQRSSTSRKYRANFCRTDNRDAETFHDVRIKISSPCESDFSLNDGLSKLFLREPTDTRQCSCDAENQNAEAVDGGQRVWTPAHLQLMRAAILLSIRTMAVYF